MAPPTSTDLSIEHTLETKSDRPAPTLLWEDVIVKQMEPEEDYDESYYDYHYDEPGSIPGTLVIDRDSPVPVLTLIEYNEESAERLGLELVEDCVPI